MGASLTGSDWAERYQQNDTPWDHGAAHPELAARLQDHRLASRSQHRRALVPGCGRGHDALALAEAGWQVTAVDWVAELVPDLDGVLEAKGGRFDLGDALGWDRHPVDLIWDHTFFCAIGLECRGVFGALARRVVVSGGRVASLVFPVGKEPELGGPPFGMCLEDLQDALGEQFELEEHSLVEHPISGRSYGQEWAEFVRVAGDPSI